MSTETGIQKLYRKDDQPFSIIPNTAIRDPKLSPQGFRLLAYLMSHNDGYELTYPQIQRETGLGSHAIKTAVTLLTLAGWLSVKRMKQKDGRFGSYSWTILTPSSKVARRNNSSLADSSLADSSLENLRDYKKKTDKKKTKEEYIPRNEFEDAFKEFYSLYPRKVGAGAARKVFDLMYPKHGRNIISGAGRLAADPNLPKAQFIPHPATWLNREGWLDEPYPERELSKVEADAIAKTKAAEIREKEIAHSQRIRKERIEAEEKAAPPPECEHGIPVWRCHPCRKKLADSLSESSEGE